MVTSTCDVVGSSTVCSYEVPQFDTLLVVQTYAQATFIFFLVVFMTFVFIQKKMTEAPDIFFWGIYNILTIPLGAN